MATTGITVTATGRGRVLPGAFTVPIVRADVPSLPMAGPGIPAPETIERARQVARRVVAGAAHLPHTGEAGELLALSLTVLHLTGG